MARTLDRLQHEGDRPALIHALSHPFGGLYDAHHGTLNGIIMPYVVKANRRKIEKDVERDFIMNAQQAKEYGIIDDIIYKTR